MIVPIHSNKFAAAYALDLIAGDPQGMPHPVRLIGIAISSGERWLRRPASPASEIWRGALLTGAIVAGSWAATQLAIRACSAPGEILLAWTALATRSLL